MAPDYILTTASTKLTGIPLEKNSQWGSGLTRNVGKQNCQWRLKKNKIPQVPNLFICYSHHQSSVWHARCQFCFFYPKVSFGQESPSAWMWEMTEHLFSSKLWLKVIEKCILLVHTYILHCRMYFKMKRFSNNGCCFLSNCRKNDGHYF